MKNKIALERDLLIKEAQKINAENNEHNTAIMINAKRIIEINGSLKTLAKLEDFKNLKK